MKTGVRTPSSSKKRSPQWRKIGGTNVELIHMKCNNNIYSV